MTYQRLNASEIYIVDLCMYWFSPSVKMIILLKIQMYEAKVHIIPVLEAHQEMCRINQAVEPEEDDESTQDLCCCFFVLSLESVSGNRMHEIIRKSLMVMEIV